MHTFVSAFQALMCLIASNRGLTAPARGCASPPGLNRKQFMAFITNQRITFRHVHCILDTPKIFAEKQYSQRLPSSGIAAYLITETDFLSHEELRIMVLPKQCGFRFDRFKHCHANQKRRAFNKIPRFSPNHPPFFTTDTPQS